jgi:hypothetical protein|tara:strand:+ start:145 stop:384 length:240 start_codon:yes stop_codon:yes gene_type:complete
MSITLPSVFQATDKIVIKQTEEGRFIIRIIHCPLYSDTITTVDDLWIHPKSSIENGELKIEKLTVVLEGIEDVVNTPRL